MISHPKPGQRVQIHYRPGLRERMPHHGKIGTILFACRARRCRNHAVLLDDGWRVSVPSGQLRALRAATSRTEQHPPA